MLDELGSIFIRVERGSHSLVEVLGASYAAWGLEHLLLCCLHFNQVLRMRGASQLHLAGLHSNTQLSDFVALATPVGRDCALLLLVRNNKVGGTVAWNSAELVWLLARESCIVVERHEALRLSGVFL